MITIKIAEARAAHGISARQLAKRAGLSKTAILLIERNEVDPRLSTMVAIATALEVSIIDLFEVG